MQAVLIEEHGGPQSMRLSDIPMPQPAAGQVLVKVAYATLNPLDVAIRSGAMTWGAPPLPYVVGGEYSGVIEAAGEGVDESLVGRRVGVRAQQGGLAQFAVAPIGAVTVLPEGIGLDLGAAYLSTTLTAWHTVHTVGRVRAGDVVLLHSAAGPVAIMTAQIAKGAGAVVIGLAGGPAKATFALGFGFDHIIDYREDAQWPAAVKALSGGRGADLIVDGVQGPQALLNLDALAPLGQVMFLGQTAGPGPAVPIGRLIAGSAAVRGMVVHHAVARSQGAEMPEINAKMASGEWRYPLNAPSRLEDVAQVFAAFENRELSGRTVFAIPQGG